MNAHQLPPGDRLENFPITFFAISMGLMGLTLVFRSVGHALDLGQGPGDFMLGIATFAFLAILGLYGAKIVRHRQAVVAEWHHPVRIAFFPAASISLLLLATAAFESFPSLAHLLWIAGVAAQSVLTLSVIAAWIGHRPFQPMHLSPAWFIPAVGNVIVPIAGVPLGYGEISWLFFSGGLVFWLILMTLVFNRMIFHDPIPGRLTPTLVILLAPPAIAFVAYLRLSGGVDGFARILLNIGYVFAAVVLTQAPKFRNLPFALSWWALSFPVAALSVASLAYARETASFAHQTIGLVLAALLLGIVLTLAVLTFGAIRRREICKPEG
ncbi:MAG: hypothetical protein RLZZ444_4252 [Pseudomonadota bacterium]|jgi:tellurite resistance protein